MEVRVLGSFGGDSPHCRMTSFLIDGSIAIDAGAITRVLSIEEQKLVRHVVITHTHIDHTATLPFLIENTFGENEGGVAIYCTRRVLSRVKKHLFNNDTWPDFSRIPNHLYPTIRFVDMKAGEAFEIENGQPENLRIRPIPVNHIVPTVGLILSRGDSTVVFSSDTGPTERLWEEIDAIEKVSAVIVECSFPTRLQSVADVSRHLTPTTLSAELKKLKRRVPIYLYHLKPPYLDELREEIAATDFPMPVEELRQGDTYCW